MTCILQLNNVKYIIADETNLMNFQAFIMTWTIYQTGLMLKKLSVKQNLLFSVDLKKQPNHELKIKLNDKKLYSTLFKISKNSIR